MGENVAGKISRLLYLSVLLFPVNIYLAYDLLNTFQDAGEAAEKAYGLFLMLLFSMILLIAFIFFIRSYMEILITKSSIHDDATKLFNRDYLDAELEKMTAYAKRYNEALSMVTVSLKGLDALDADVRAEVLVTSASVVRSEVRNSDVACRYDEHTFMVVAPRTDSDRVEVLVHRLEEDYKSLDADEMKQVEIDVSSAAYDLEEESALFLERVAAVRLK